MTSGKRVARSRHNRELMHIPKIESRKVHTNRCSHRKVRIQRTIIIATTQQILLLSDDLLLTTDSVSHNPKRMSIPVSKGHRCVLELTKLPSCNAFDIGVTSFSICEVSRKLIDHAITVRYASGQLSNHKLVRCKTIDPILSYLAHE